jgi:hypothetical protein
MSQIPMARLFAELDHASKAGDLEALATFRRLSESLEVLGLQWADVPAFLSSSARRQSSFMSADPGEYFRFLAGCELKAKERIVHGIEDHWLKTGLISEAQAKVVADVAGRYGCAVEQDDISGRSPGEWRDKHREWINARRSAQFEAQQEAAAARELEREKHRLLAEQARDRRAAFRKQVEEDPALLDRWSQLVREIGPKHAKADPKAFQLALGGEGSSAGRVAIALVSGFSPEELWFSVPSRFHLGQDMANWRRRSVSAKLESGDDGAR